MFFSRLVKTVATVAKSNTGKAIGNAGEVIFEIITNDDEIDQKLQHEYEQILELGKAIHEIINNHEIDLDSLRPEHKEALDLYISATS